MASGDMSMITPIKAESDAVIHAPNKVTIKALGVIINRPVITKGRYYSGINGELL